VTCRDRRARHARLRRELIRERIERPDRAGQAIDHCEALTLSGQVLAIDEIEIVRHHETRRARQLAPDQLAGVIVCVIDPRAVIDA